jgi:transcriptional regulator with XRE-family HTH domain
MNNSLKSLRLQKGLTLETLARNAGVGVSTINNFENGRTEASEDVLKKIAAILGVTVQRIRQENKTAMQESVRKRHSGPLLTERIADREELAIVHQSVQILLRGESTEALTRKLADIVLDHALPIGHRIATARFLLNELENRDAQNLEPMPANSKPLSEDQQLANKA